MPEFHKKKVAFSFFFFFNPHIDERADQQGFVTKLWFFSFISSRNIGNLDPYSDLPVSVKINRL